MARCCICGGIISDGMYSVEVSEGRCVCGKCVPLMVRCADRLLQTVEHALFKEDSHDDRGDWAVFDRPGA